MSDLSPILSLPLLQAAQAQKHITHNEALRLLDVLVQPAVASRSTATPPAFPSEGQRFILPAAPTGAWGGQAGAIAFYEQEAWVFLLPQPGWQAHVLDEAVTVTWNGTAWRSPAEAPAAFSQLGIGGATADATNRLAAASPATLLTHTGSGHQLKINKATATDTASLLFQTGWSGRAEMGTTGSDGFAIKTSANGSAWTTALQLAAGTGIATGSAVQSDALDTTAGRLMPVGAFGLGHHAAAVPGADWNNATISGAIFNSNTAANAPTAGIWYIGTYHANSAAYGVQYVTNLTGGQTWQRRMTNTIWSPWQETSAAVSGSNANGNWLRLADGTQICSADVPLAFSNGTTLAAVWTLPAAFSAIGAYSWVGQLRGRTASNVADGVSTAKLLGAQLHEVSHSASLISLRVSAPSSVFVAGESAMASLHAIGRWK